MQARAYSCNRMHTYIYYIESKNITKNCMYHHDDDYYYLLRVVFMRDYRVYESRVNYCGAQFHSATFANFFPVSLQFYLNKNFETKR